MKPFRDQPIGRKMTLLLVYASAAVLLLSEPGAQAAHERVRH